MPISDASAFQDTLERLRQRYALHFYWPEGAADPERRTVVVSLAHSTGAHYAGSEVRYRRAYIANAGMRHAGGLVEVSREADPTDGEGKRSSRPTLAGGRPSADVVDDAVQSPSRRRVAVNERSQPVVNAIDVEPEKQGGETAAPPTSTATNEAPPSPAPVKHGGWRRVDESKSRPNDGGPIQK
jgi:hypothetical protein